MPAVPRSPRPFSGPGGGAERALLLRAQQAAPPTAPAAAASFAAAYSGTQPAVGLQLADWRAAPAAVRARRSAWRGSCRASQPDGRVGRQPR
eukprot:scaffold75336_cov32-Tisochrysis_lutea.AAC.1